MINVSNETETAYKSDGIHKELIIKFPSLSIEIGNSSIVQGSFQLDEAIQSGSSIECVGCIASSMQVKIANLTDSVIKGTKVEAYIKAGETDTIPLFHGIVDSSKKEANRKLKTIKAYDVLYTLSTKDATNYYNNHSETTVLQLLYDVLNKYEIPYENISLVNGSLTAYCGKNRKASSLSALNLVKSICQINGCFGKINRNGKFEVVYLKTPSQYDIGDLYPSNDVYPSSYVYPGYNDGSQTKGEVLNFYESVEYEDFKVKPVDYIIIRDSSNSDYQIQYGTGTNKYIIQGNIFAYDQDGPVLENVAKNIYNSVSRIYYTPFESKNNGLPYLECGDSVIYTDITHNKNTQTTNQVQFYIFSRTLSGEVFLRDNYESEGDEYQHEFITDISVSLSEVQQQIEDAVNEIDERLDEYDEAIGDISDTVDEISQTVEKLKNVLYIVSWDPTTKTLVTSSDNPDDMKV